MGWKEAFQYAKGLAANRGVEAARDAPRADAGLPLGARIGGLVKLQMSPFIRANANGSLIDVPANAEALIKSISRVKLELPGKLYRYYLATGDDGAEKETFLQAYQDDKGGLAELMYCVQLTRIIPETEQDQKAFTGEDGYGLGEKSYSLWKEQLAEIGYPAAALEAAFGTSGRIDYRRDAGPPATDFVEPFTGSETRIDDAAGEHGLEQRVYFMPYARELGADREYLLISTEIIGSRDGDPSRREIHVDLMLGLPLEPERVVIQ